MPAWQIAAVSAAANDRLARARRHVEDVDRRGADLSLHDGDECRVASAQGLWPYQPQRRCAFAERSGLARVGMQA